MLRDKKASLTGRSITLEIKPSNSQRLFHAFNGVEWEAIKYNRDLGSYFENYIYLILRNKKTVYYLYENTVEIDFYTDDKILIESKFYSQLNEKQKKLFSEYPADKKIVIDSVGKLALLSEL